MSVAAAACILGALVFGLSRVDFNTGSSSVAGGGASAGAEQGASPTTFGRASPSFGVQGADGVSTAPGRRSAGGSSQKLLRTLAVPRPLRAAVLPRYQLALPLRHAFAAIDPHHGRGRR